MTDKVRRKRKEQDLSHISATVFLWILYKRLILLILGLFPTWSLISALQELNMWIPFELYLENWKYPSFTKTSFSRKCITLIWKVLCCLGLCCLNESADLSLSILGITCVLCFPCARCTGWVRQWVAPWLQLFMNTCSAPTQRWRNARLSWRRPSLLLNNARIQPRPRSLSSLSWM